MLTIYTNRKSDKHFILIKAIDADTGLFVTPGNREIALPFNLFQKDSFEDDEKNLLNDSNVTCEQVIKYEQYKKNRVDEDTGNVADMIIEAAQQQGRINALLGYLDEMEYAKKNDKLLIKLRERFPPTKEL